MCNHKYPDFTTARLSLVKKMLSIGQIHARPNWQSTSVKKIMWELFNAQISVPVYTTDVDKLAEDIKPNLPWATDHFMERVSGIAYNPPPSASHWPFAQKDNEQFKSDSIFSHTYPERFWPNNSSTGGVIKDEQEWPMGIRFRFGDYQDVISLLVKDPYTRQAYLPIFFPEDTGAGLDRRVPCTLGYHFINYYGYLHVNYYMRSCDLLRHYNDDVYMAVLLLLHTIDLINNQSNGQVTFNPGSLNMFITNLHIFENDTYALRKSQ